MLSFFYNITMKKEKGFYCHFSTLAALYDIKIVFIVMQIELAELY